MTAAATRSPLGPACAETFNVVAMRAWGKRPDTGGSGPRRWSPRTR